MFNHSPTVSLMMFLNQHRKSFYFTISCFSLHNSNHRSFNDTRNCFGFESLWTIGAEIDWKYAVRNWHLTIYLEPLSMILLGIYRFALMLFKVQRHSTYKNISRDFSFKTIYKSKQHSIDFSFLGIGLRMLSRWAHKTFFSAVSAALVLIKRRNLKREMRRKPVYGDVNFACSMKTKLENS